MTNLEALQAFPDFDDLPSNLLIKSLIDRNVVSSSQYGGTSTETKNIDLCAADIYLALVSRPEYREGGQSEKWNDNALMKARAALYKKWGLNPPENANKVANINGEEVW